MGTSGKVGATQQATSLRAFGRAMRSSDAVFAERLEGFAAQFGSPGDDALALLSQAAYFCWFHGEYRANLPATCRAIGADRPGSLYLCGHISPGRWRGLHAYVIGVQRWLGVDHPVPGLVDAARVQQVRRWLGESTVARRALARLYLCQLVDHLTRRTTFSVLTDGLTPDAAEFQDFGAWYARPDGGSYGRPADTPGMAAEEGDTSDRGGARSRVPAHGGYARACADEARLELAALPDWAGRRNEADELVAGIASPSQPPCMHRFERYQDIKLISIGRLKWRADLPPDPSRQEWEEFWSAAEAALQSWLAGQPPANPVGDALHGALGAPVPRSRAIVADFLLQPPPGTGCFSWLIDQARRQGLAPSAGLGVEAS